MAFELLIGVCYEGIYFGDEGVESLVDVVQAPGSFPNILGQQALTHGLQPLGMIIQRLQEVRDRVDGGHRGAFLPSGGAPPPLLLETRLAARRLYRKRYSPLSEGAMTEG